MKGKVVLITGGAGALGQTVVPAFVSTGASVILGDLNPVQVPGVTALKADFTDQTQVRSFVDQVIRAPEKGSGVFSDGNISRRVA